MSQSRKLFFWETILPLCVHLPDVMNLLFWAKHSKQMRLFLNRSTYPPISLHSSQFLVQSLAYGSEMVKWVPIWIFIAPGRRLDPWFQTVLYWWIPWMRLEEWQYTSLVSAVWQYQAAEELRREVREVDNQVCQGRSTHSHPCSYASGRALALRPVRRNNRV